MGLERCPVCQEVFDAPPFTGETTYELMEKHVHAPPPSLFEAVPFLAPALVEAVERSLAKAPDQRLPPAAAFRACLEAIR